MNSSPLLLCARQELLLAVRSRWTQIFAMVFAALSLGVAFSGYVLTGGYGAQDFARTAASLVQLVLLLVPLASLLMGALALAPERSATELLFSQPVPRTSALQHASQLSAVERSYVAKYPGESGTAIRLIAEELLARVAAANAPGAKPPVASNTPPSFVTPVCAFQSQTKLES